MNHACVWLSLLLLFFNPSTSTAQPVNRITVLVDAFSDHPGLRQDWGFSALIEHGDRRILFDTGNNSEVFAHNCRALGVDLTQLDFVVISHRHGDHTDGLRHLLRLNPGVRIFVPDDEYFGGPTPKRILGRPDNQLPKRMRYFGGEIPEDVPHGTPWQGANFVRVGSVFEVAPGFRLVRNIAPAGQFVETPELALAIDTPNGQVLVVGCSHPGIEQILRSINATQSRVGLIVGGLHLVEKPDAEIERIFGALRTEFGVGSMAPGHCTGEPGFRICQRVFDRHYRYAGAGTVLTIP